MSSGHGSTANIPIAQWSRSGTGRPVAIPAGFHMDFLLPFNKPGYKSLSGRPMTARRRSLSVGPSDIRRFLDEFEPLYAATRGRGFIAIPTGNDDTVPRLGDGKDPQSRWRMHSS